MSFEDEYKQRQKRWKRIFFTINALTAIIILAIVIIAAVDLLQQQG